MTITLNLSAETKRKLHEQAARASQTVEAYVEDLVERDTQLAYGGVGDRLAEPEFDERLNDLSDCLPPLPTLPADWSRADVYADHA